MKYFFIAAGVGFVAILVAGYAFFLLQRGTKDMAPSMIEHAAIAPLGSGMPSARKIQ